MAATLSLVDLEHPHPPYFEGGYGILDYIHIDIDVGIYVGIDIGIWHGGYYWRYRH